MKPTLEEMRRLVGNPDAYAVQNEDGSWLPVRERLTNEVLVQHTRQLLTAGTYVGHVVDGETFARTLVFDVDDGKYEHAVMLQAALVELGVPHMNTGIEDSGRKGYHVWLPLQGYRHNSELRRLGRAALALARAKAPEISAATEVFPKQDEVRDLGNLVKLPGGVHRVTWRQNNMVGPFPQPISTRRWEQILSDLPPEVAARRPVSESRFPCMEQIQQGVDSNRNIKLFHLATMMRRAGVDDENTDLVLHRVNELGDPLDDWELESVLENSKMAGPVCDQIDRPCGDLCLKERMKGLYTRPGQLRFAQAGECVVVTMEGHEGNVVTLDHPDVSKMKAALKLKGPKS